LLLLSALALWPVVALAHALLVESSPKQDETLAAPTTQAVLRFNAKIEKAVTRVTLVDGAGKPVTLPARPEDKDGPADRLLVALPARLPPGRYQLRYTVLASDGHATPGVVRFTVAGAAATRPAAAAATAPAKAAAR
jgi:methionine-rich copper-binding protein CopC